MPSIVWMWLGLSGSTWQPLFARLSPFLFCLWALADGILLSALPGGSGNFSPRLNPLGTKFLLSILEPILLELLVPLENVFFSSASQICKVATWSLALTFSKFYQVDVQAWFSWCKFRLQSASSCFRSFFFLTLVFLRAYFQFCCFIVAHPSVYCLGVSYGLWIRVLWLVLYDLRKWES